MKANIGKMIGAVSLAVLITASSAHAMKPIFNIPEIPSNVTQGVSRAMTIKSLVTSGLNIAKNMKSMGPFGAVMGLASVAVSIDGATGGAISGAIPGGTDFMNNGGVFGAINNSVDGVFPSLDSAAVLNAAMSGNIAGGIDIAGGMIGDQFGAEVGNTFNKYGDTLGNVYMNGGFTPDTALRLGDQFSADVFGKSIANGNLDVGSLRNYVASSVPGLEGQFNEWQQSLPPDMQGLVSYPNVNSIVAGGVSGLAYGQSPNQVAAGMGQQFESNVMGQLGPNGSAYQNGLGKVSNKLVDGAGKALNDPAFLGLTGPNSGGQMGGFYNDVLGGNDSLLSSTNSVIGDTNYIAGAFGQSTDMYQMSFPGVGNMVTNSIGGSTAGAVGKLNLGQYGIVGNYASGALNTVGGMASSYAGKAAEKYLLSGADSIYGSVGGLFGDKDKDADRMTSTPLTPPDLAKELGDLEKTYKAASKVHVDDKNLDTIRESRSKLQLFYASAVADSYANMAIVSGQIAGEITYVDGKGKSATQGLIESISKAKDEQQLTAFKNSIAEMMMKQKGITNSLSSLSLYLESVILMTATTDKTHEIKEGK